MHERTPVIQSYKVPIPIGTPELLIKLELRFYFFYNFQKLTILYLINYRVCIVECNARCLPLAGGVLRIMLDIVT